MDGEESNSKNRDDNDVSDDGGQEQDTRDEENNVNDEGGERIESRRSGRSAFHLISLLMMRDQILMDIRVTKMKENHLYIQERA